MAHIGVILTGALPVTIASWLVSIEVLIVCNFVELFSRCIALCHIPPAPPRGPCSTVGMAFYTDENWRPLGTPLLTPSYPMTVKNNLFQ